MDPLAEERSWMTPYNYVQNNPILRIDPTGALDNPIYDTGGNFLGTDDRGLQGDAIVMNASNFTQGMSHNQALASNLGTSVMSEGAQSAMASHFSGLSSRPDYDGFVTVSEGIEWARANPGALVDPTADNTLYIDASKLDFGDLYISDFVNVGEANPQNLFTEYNLQAAVGNSNIRATVYALGRVDMILHEKATREVSIVNNPATDYDWNRGGSAKRRAFINAERARTGLNDTHGFRASYYGRGTLNRPYEPTFPNAPGATEHANKVNEAYYKKHQRQ